MNKKNKNKNMTNARQEFNKILLHEWNKNTIKLWQENIPEIGVEQIKGDGKFYFYLCSLGI